LARLPAGGSVHGDRGRAGGLGRRRGPGSEQSQDRRRRARAHRRLGGNNPPRGATTRVDRSSGDVHPLGNPHYSLDPELAPIVTQNIVDGLIRVAPELRGTFEKNRQAFLGRLEEAMVRWTRMLEPFKGARVVVYHPDYIYFLTRFGLVQAGMLEDR